MPPRAGEDRTRVAVARVNPSNAWIRGADVAKAALRAAGEEEDALFSSGEVDWAVLSQKGNGMFKPDGVWLGVSDGDFDGDVDEKVEVESTVESGDAARDVETVVEDSGVLGLKRKVITVKDRDGAETNVGKVFRETCRDALSPQKDH